MRTFFNKYNVVLIYLGFIFFTFTPAISGTWALFSSEPLLPWIVSHIPVLHGRTEVALDIVHVLKLTLSLAVAIIIAFAWWEQRNRRLAEAKLKTKPITGTPSPIGTMASAPPSAPTASGLYTVPTAYPMPGFGNPIRRCKACRELFEVATLGSSEPSPVNCPTCGAPQLFDPEAPNG